MYISSLFKFGKIDAEKESFGEKNISVMTFNYFNNLPSELQIYILTINVNGNIICLNKEYNQHITVKSTFNDYCLNKYISLDELQQFRDHNHRFFDDYGIIIADQDLFHICLETRGNINLYNSIHLHDFMGTYDIYQINDLISYKNKYILIHHDIIKNIIKNRHSARLYDNDYQNKFIYNYYMRLVSTFVKYPVIICNYLMAIDYTSSNDIFNELLINYWIDNYDYWSLGNNETTIKIRSVLNDFLKTLLIN